MLSTRSIASTQACSASSLRRSKTLGSKVPRKRTALLVQSKRSTAQALAVLGAGGDGPTGSGNNGGSGRPFEPCCGGSGGDGQRGRGPFSWNVSPQGIAVTLLGLGLVGASQAGPAWAAAGQQPVIITNPSTASSVSLNSAAESHAAVSCLTTSEDEFSTPIFRTLPDSYTPDAFGEEEKELVCPKQYRVREWVCVK